MSDTIKLIYRKDHYPVKPFIIPIQNPSGSGSNYRKLRIVNSACKSSWLCERIWVYVRDCDLPKFDAATGIVLVAALNNTVCRIPYGAILPCAPGENGVREFDVAEYAGYVWTAAFRKEDGSIVDRRGATLDDPTPQPVGLLDAINPADTYAGACLAEQLQKESEHNKN